MVVRGARLGVSMNMRQNAEAEFGIFIEDLALRDVIAEMGGNEVVVLQHVL